MFMISFMLWCLDSGSRLEPQTPQESHPTTRVSCGRGGRRCLWYLCYESWFEAINMVMIMMMMIMVIMMMGDDDGIRYVSWKCVWEYKSSNGMNIGKSTCKCYFLKYHQKRMMIRMRRQDIQNQNQNDLFALLLPSNSNILRSDCWQEIPASLLKLFLGDPLVQIFIVPIKLSITRQPYYIIIPLVFSGPHLCWKTARRTWTMQTHKHNQHQHWQHHTGHRISVDPFPCQEKAHVSLYYQTFSICR